MKKQQLWKLFLITFFSSLMAVSSSVVGQEVNQNEIVITGKIVDMANQELIGVSVKVQDTKTGIVTDIDGNFTLKVPVSATLEVSYVGFKSQTIKVGSKRDFLIKLQEDNQLLEEVVVVGYGTQKKVNMSGAVSAVEFSKAAENRAMTSVSAGLAGLSPGVFVSQSGGGRPGADGATIRIRGQGSLNNSDPLVIIDGTVGNMEDVSPQDIENISVLKDAASASIYGSRAANGVILITTKRGKDGTAVITYNAQFTAQTPSHKMNIVSNYADYMSLVNEATISANTSGAKLKIPFSDARITEWREAGNSNPLKYPNTDWQDELFSTGWMQNHTLSVRGGNENTKYLFSGNYLHNPGIMENSAFERVSARVNVDSQVKKWLTMGVSAYGYQSKADAGTSVISAVLGTNALATTPGMHFVGPDGKYGGVNNSEDDLQAAANNPIFRLNSIKGNTKMNKIVSRFYARINPIKNLNIEASYTYDFTNKFLYSQPVGHDLWNFYDNSVQIAAEGKSSVTNNDEKWYRYISDVVATYNIKISKLDISAMAGASQESYRKQWVNAWAEDLTFPDNTELNATNKNPTLSGNYANWAMHSYFGRVNLGWNEKYLLEMNLRADGSSRFRPGKRWGVFPSFSGAWRMNEEAFMNDVSWIDALKLRASWGTLGSNILSAGDAMNDGNYEYMAFYTKSNYPLNGEIQTGAIQSALSNANITWETAYNTNFGVDFTALRQHLTGSFDYFIKDTKDILWMLPAPLVHGTSTIPWTNAADVRNSGFEITLGWRNKIGEVDYSITGNMTYVNNKITKFKGESISGNRKKVEGSPIDVLYVLEVDRIVQTDEDLAYVKALKEKYPNYFKTYTQPEKGDILYKDTNNDGIIDDNDKVEVGTGVLPKVTYGVTLAASWKGLDFSCLIQGQGNYKSYTQGYYYGPIARTGWMINKDVADGRWYEGRTDATYPRLLPNGYSQNTQYSTMWIQNKQYMRIKNVQLGYTFPKALVNKAMIDNLRLYVSVDNLLTFTKYKGLDPEITGMGYPPLRQVTFGLNVSF